MHDPRTLLDPATDAVRKLARRGHQLDLVRLEKLFGLRGSVVGEADEARAEANRLAARIDASNKRGEDVTALREYARSVKTHVQELA
jgi:seryl-tRNA synthetase